MSDSRPIGIFDSGLGGLTVVKAIQTLLPNESILYFGDTARVPYGNKSKNLVQQYAKEITDFLIKHNAKIIVVACNTASALALYELKKHNSVPVLGVIEPGTLEAIKSTKNKHIGVIGTIATISSRAYETALLVLDKDIQTSSKACPLFVPLAEEGWLDGDVTEKIAAHYLTPLNERKVDTLILGCTHYPLLKNVIAGQMSSSTILIDSADAVARSVQTCLSDSSQLDTNNETGELSCFVTDIPMRFETVGQRFLGAPMDNVQQQTIYNF